MNTNENNRSEQSAPFIRRHPQLTFYHANTKGTGCAMSLSLYPALDNNDGCIRVSLANQCAIGNRQGPQPTFARFDWEHSLNVKFEFGDLCQILQVLRGECESVGGDKGLFHRSAIGMTRIVFRHLLEPVTGYSLEVYRSHNAGGDESRSHILLNTAEALGLSEIIAGSLGIISFGMPRVPEISTAAAPTANKKVVEDAAA